MRQISRWQAAMGAGVLMSMLAGSAEAKLQFEQRRVTAAAELGDEQVQAVFAFENVGEAAVTITDVTSSCGCTAGVPDKRTYEPGETGEVTVTLNVGERQGDYTSRLVVRTDAAASPATTLTLTATLPTLVHFEPRLLVWRADEPLASKDVLVIVQAEEELLLHAEAEADDHWTVALEPVTEKAGEVRDERETIADEKPRYRLTVTPKAMAADSSSSRVWLVVNSNEGNEQRFGVRMRVLLHTSSNNVSATAEAE